MAKPQAVHPHTVQDRDQGKDKSPTCLGRGPHGRQCAPCTLWRICLRMKDDPKYSPEDEDPETLETWR